MHFTELLSSSRINENVYVSQAIMSNSEVTSSKVRVNGQYTAEIRSFETVSYSSSINYESINGIVVA